MENQHRDIKADLLQTGSQVGNHISVCLNIHDSTEKRASLIIMSSSLLVLCNMGIKKGWGHFFGMKVSQRMKQLIEIGIACSIKGRFQTNAVLKWILDVHTLMCYMLLSAANMKLTGLLISMLQLGRRRMFVHPKTNVRVVDVRKWQMVRHL